MSAHAASVGFSSYTFATLNSGGTSVTPLATADQSFDENIGFTYTGSWDTVTQLKIAFPPGLLERLGSVPTASECTYANLAGNCPSGGVIGSTSGSAQVNLLGGITASLSGNVYLMSSGTGCLQPPANTTAVAYIGVDVSATAVSIVNISNAVTVCGPVLFSNAAAGPQLTAELPLPTTASVPLFGSEGIQLSNIGVELNGTTVAGAPFTWMPSTCVPATGTVTVTTAQNATGSDSATLTPTGCASLPYTPQVAVSAAQDSSDNGLALNASITQPSTVASNGTTQAASSTEELTFPSTLVPNFGAALTDMGNCPTSAGPTYSSCTPVGTVTAATPLLSSPLTGSVYLTGTTTPQLAPQLVLVFPSPFSMTVTGAVSLQQNSVTFTGVPDLPLTALTVALTGGSSSLYEMESCGAFTASQLSAGSASGTVSGAFTGQNGGNANSSATLTLSTSVCPTPKVTVPAPSTQSTTVGTAVSLQIAGVDSANEPLTYTATGLPAGLSISPTGAITGEPTTAGTYTVSVTATDSSGATASQSFSWTVTAASGGSDSSGSGGSNGGSSSSSGGTNSSGGSGGSSSALPAVSASATALTGASTQRTLKVNVSNAKHGVTSVTASLPSGMHFVASKKLARYVVVKGAKVRSIKLVHGRLVITFKQAVKKVTITVKHSALSVSTSLEAKIRKHRIKQLTLELIVTGSSHTSSTVKTAFKV